MSELYNLPLIQEAFGVYGRFPVYFVDAPSQNQEQYYTSEITGAKVWDRITIKNPDNDNLNYLDEKGNVVVMPSFTFPESCIN